MRLLAQFIRICYDNLVFQGVRQKLTLSQKYHTGKGCEKQPRLCKRKKKEKNDIFS
jgi:hypothetical protein